MMASITRPLVVSFAVLPVVGLAGLAAIPWFVSRQPQILTHQPERVTIKSSSVDHRRVVDTRLAPYAAIGKFAGTLACTAAIVLDPSIIVTAGHCITERDGSIRRSNLSFRLGYRAGDDLGRFQATVLAVGANQSFRRQSVHAAAQDWAILALDRVADGVQPLIISHYSIPALRSSEQQLLMPAYSDDIGDADILSVDPACSVRDLVWDVLVHDCRARYGSSGAPLLIRDGTRYAVVGIHTGSMFASGEDGHVAKFVGYRAVGSWAFADTLLVLTHPFTDPLQLGDSHVR
jgi:V8-like Glu-specific endopeptidase